MSKRVGTSKRKIGPADRGFVLDDYVMYNLVRGSAAYSDEMEAALKSYGLNTMKWRILMLLHDKSPISVGNLACRAVSKMPTLTRMLIRMENEGLVRRTALEDDRRIIQVSMTPKSVAVIRKVQEIGQRVFERAFNGIDGAEVALVTDVMKRVRANLERSPYDAVDDTGELESRGKSKVRV